MKENVIVAVMQQLKELQLEPEKRNQASTGFELMTFAIFLFLCPICTHSPQNRAVPLCSSISSLCVANIAYRGGGGGILFIRSKST